MKIAFIYDWFDSTGGAERIIQSLHTAYPDAPWYTLYRDRTRASWTEGWDIHTSFLQRLPTWLRHNRLLTMPFMGMAFESFDLSAYDIVVSITSAYAKAVITQPHTRHLCYILTPPRWLWYETNSIDRRILPIFRPLIRLVLHLARSYDLLTSNRPDAYWAISTTVAKRCADIYDKTAHVIYPPFDNCVWRDYAAHSALPSTISPLYYGKYLLVVSRLEPYKRIDLAIEVARQTSIPLVIVGTGSQLYALRKQAGDMITTRLQENMTERKSVLFLSGLSDRELAGVYRYARALLMPQLEDFGYTALEAQACGCPVVAYGAGGAKETIAHGVFFPVQSVVSIVQALEKLSVLQYNREYENRHICRWSRDTIVAALTEEITKTI